MKINEAIMAIKASGATGPIAVEFSGGGDEGAVESVLCGDINIAGEQRQAIED